MNLFRIEAVSLLLAPLALFSSPSRESRDSLPVYGYEVINIYPHDTAAYTQGLVYKDGYWYEGTGRWGHSTLRKVEYESGTVIKIHHLADQYFGEGVTICRDTISQLTWTNGVGFMYIDGNTFECIGTFTYTTYGWGLTHNDTCLIMSDGTPVIRFIDPTTHQVIRQITVTADSVEVHDLNELEYLQGMIYANVWHSESIAVIDPADGHVACWINCHGLLTSPPNVLNGIAFDPDGVRLFVTGKVWPALFEIKVDPVNYPPRITDFFPGSPCSVPSGTRLILGVSAADPDPQDSLSCAWKINGLVDTSAHGMTYSYRRAGPATDTITAIVDDRMYRDSVSWIVHVSPADYEQSTAGKPGFDILIPNPFYPDARLMYSLAVPARVTIAVYDVAGRKAGMLIDGMQPVGIHNVHLTAAVVPGVYFFSINIGGENRKYKRVFIE